MLDAAELARAAVTEVQRELRKLQVPITARAGDDEGATLVVQTGPLDIDSAVLEALFTGWSRALVQHITLRAEAVVNVGVAGVTPGTGAVAGSGTGKIK